MNRTSMIEVFQGSSGSLNIKSSKLKRAARALQWRQSFQNKDVCFVDVNNTRVEISQIPNPETSGIGTGGQVWPAALVLAKYIEKKYTSLSLFNNMSVCELGSGTGVDSIACIVLGFKHVVITDQDGVFPLIIKNCQKLLNFQIDSTGLKYTNNSQCIHICSYDWGEDIQPLTLLLDTDIAYDLIIVSDCILPKLYPIEPLVKVLSVICLYASNL